MLGWRGLAWSDLLQAAPERAGTRSYCLKQRTAVPVSVLSI